jgi:excisionase family DNA binding protein
MLLSAGKWKDYGRHEMKSSKSEIEEAGGLARVEDASRFLALSRSAVYKLMDRGELPFLKIGKARRIAWSALRDLVARCEERS